ncbi:uncharacterized protein LOC143281441 [Babylonia areolata]|uniref:uncharacterized protein LOC143281441 n=1 Tax=Babylonia areolata TaxID=304850 RepID=UPI003FD5053B
MMKDTVDSHDSFMSADSSAVINTPVVHKWPIRLLVCWNAWSESLRNLDMPARHVVLVVAVVLFQCCVEAAMGSRRANPYTSHCSKVEQSYLFNRCLQAFGLAHFQHWGDMARAKTCLHNRLQCRAAGTVVRCIQSLFLTSRTRLSSRCRSGIKETLSYMMTKHNFNCNYHDVECKCWRFIPDIDAKGQSMRLRPQRCPTISA